MPQRCIGRFRNSDPRRSRFVWLSVVWRANLAVPPIAIVPQEPIDLFGQFDLLVPRRRVGRRDGGEEFEQLRARAHEQAERLQHIPLGEIIVADGVPIQIVLERRLVARMGRAQRSNWP